MNVSAEDLTLAMQRWGVLEEPVPEAARRWIDSFLIAYGDGLTAVEQARPAIDALRAEACMIPALELERLRSRDVLFFLDSVGQYVDHQPELRDLPLEHDLAAIADEFGLSAADARSTVRMALTGTTEGPPLELLFPLLGHDRILMRVGAVNSKLLHGRGLKPIERGPDGAPFTPIRGRGAPSDADPNPAVDGPG
jgi:Anticodon binding domain